MKKLGLLLPDLRIGGIGRLASELSLYFSRTAEVHLLLCSPGVELPCAGRVHGLGISDLHHLGTDEHEMHELLSRRAAVIGAAKRELGLEATLSLGTESNLLNVLSRAGDRIVLSSHSFLSISRAARTGPNSLLQDQWIRVLYAQADAVIALTGRMGSDLVGHWGVPAGKIRVIPGGLDLCRLGREADEPPASNDRLHARVPMIVSIGALRSVKAHEALVIAMARMKRTGPGLQLALIGEGAERRVLAAAIEHHRLNDVHLLGEVRNPLPWLARACIFVLPSLSEGLPLVLVEALHLGIPVIAADCLTGPRELLAPGGAGRMVGDGIECAEFGILVHRAAHGEDVQGYSERLATAIEFLISDGALMGHYRARGPVRARDFDIGTIGERWQQELVG